MNEIGKSEKPKGKGLKTLERMVKDGRKSDVKRDGITPYARQHAADLVGAGITRQWKQPKSLTRAARLWERSFNVIDLRELNIVSAWTAYQNIFECVPPEKIVSYDAFRKVIQRIMVPLGHAFGVRHIELSRMDTQALSPETLAKTMYYIVNGSCLPLYVAYFNMKPKQRAGHSIEYFMRIITSLTPEEIDDMFSVRYDHMWLARFPRGFTEHTWVWSGRMWDGAGNPRDVELYTLRPVTSDRLSYDEDYIREHNQYVDRAFGEDSYNEEG